MPERGDAARRAWYTMKHGKVNIKGLIVDYIEASRFEGRIIEHTWNNMGWTPKLVDKLRGNWKAGEAIAELGPKYDVIHISAHGNAHGISRDEDSTEGITTENMEFLFKMKNKTKGLKKVVLVVNSACCSSSKEWADLFTRRLGSNLLRWRSKKIGIRRRDRLPRRLLPQDVELP